MSILFDLILLPLTTGLILLATTIIIYFKYFAFKYWEKRGIPCETPTIPTGNVGNLLIGRITFGVLMKNLYEVYKSKGYKHAGFYFMNQPTYMPLDPDIIKQILIKDFQHFVDRGVYFDEEREPLTAHLFSIEGQKWKNLRAKLSPTFTSGKMKMMFQTLVDCSEQLKVVCDDKVVKNEVLEIKDVFARFTTDIIGSCAFGLECNSLKNPDAEFRKMGKRVFDQTFIEGISNLIGFGSVKLAKLLRIRLFPQKISHFFMDAVKQTIDYREKTNMKRNDFMQLLMQLKNQGGVEGDDGKLVKTDGANITFNDIAAQAFVFFLAGFETSSTTGTFCLMELAMNTEIQDKLREEVQRVLKEYDGKITYEGVMKMTYMEKVVQETLRKYPAAPMLNRKCTSDSYKVPNTDLVLEKGTSIIIPILGLQQDPEYFPNPEVFDPERFNEENKGKRHPCVYLPFGEGPRICIGLRFGMMQTKVGLAVLLSRYSFALNKKTKLPIKFTPTSFILTAEGGIWLDIKKITA